MINLIIQDGDKVYLNNKPCPFFCDYQKRQMDDKFRIYIEKVQSCTFCSTRSSISNEFEVILLFLLFLLFLLKISTFFQECVSGNMQLMANL